MAELNPNSYDFKAFIDEFPLPQVVKVIEGIYGSEDELTLSALQVIHLHFLKNNETVKATDERQREFYLPLNSAAKVSVLPSSAYEEFYVSVEKLAKDFPTYVQACNDDSELEIEAGDVLELKGVMTNPHNERFLKCIKLKCTKKRKQEVLIPFLYQPKFKTLGDFFEHSNLFLKEVVAKAPHFPLKVSFQDDVLKTRRRDINAGCPTGFNQLGTFTLKETLVMKLVVATSCGAHHGSKRTLLTVPHDLNISVTPVLPGENKRCDCQTRKIKNFRINFNEMSFRYGCNVIEGHLSKQVDIKKPIPRARNRVTPSVTQLSSGNSGYKMQTVNNSLGFSSYPSFETQKEMARSEDIVERRDGKMPPSNQKQEDEYVDMSFASTVCFDEPESSLIQQQWNVNLNTADATDIADSSATATATSSATVATDDDEGDCGGGGSGGKDDNGNGGVPAADYDDGDSKNGPTSTTDIPPSSANTFPEENDKTNVYDTPVIPWNAFIQQLSNQPTCPPGSTFEYPRDDTDDDLFQGGDGHLDLPPPVPTKQNFSTRSASFDEEVEDVQQYEPMSGQVGERHHSNVQNTFKETRRQMSDVEPSISHDSPPASNPQTKPKKAKSKMRRNIEKMMLRSTHLKRSKSTTDIMPSEDYQYVESIPEANADKKTDLGEFFSRIRKPKKKGSKEVSPVDYLSTMTVDEVSESLKCLNLHRYVETFRANTVDGSLFLDLNDKMLDELQVTSEIDRLKIRKLQTEGWTPKYQ